MSYVILGQTIKNEYLALGTMISTGLGAWAATRGGSKKAEPQGAGKAALEKVKESVPFNASSSEEENFIRKFVADAEKEDSKH